MLAIDPGRRLGSQGRLLETDLLRALLVPDRHSFAVLRWFEGIGDSPLVITEWSLLELDGGFSGLEPDRAEATRELLAEFLAERCAVAWFEPSDYGHLRQFLRYRPGLVPLDSGLILALAYRRALLPCCLLPPDPVRGCPENGIGSAAQALGYPWEAPGFKSNRCWPASLNPNW